MFDCPANMTVFTSELTKTVEWSVPEFIDPHNESLEVFTNYPEAKWTFPWGDFNVSYSALKPSNGLRTECLFEIRVRPYPCNDIGAPINGAILCNNWKKDYGQFCVHLCQESYTVGRGINPNNIYVCGASGSWLPSSDSPDCNDMYRYMLIFACVLYILPLCQAWFWGKSESSGVTAKKIADKAYGYEDSTVWAFGGCKGGNRFCDKNKCNLFVNDVLKSVGATVPQRHWYNYSPISANDWGDSNSSRVKKTGCYTFISSFWSKQPGDIIAFPSSEGSGHVGIVYYNNEYISAGEKKVNKKGIPNITSTIWRYKYDDDDC